MHNINEIIINAIDKIENQNSKKDYSPKVFSSVIYGTCDNGYYKIPYNGILYSVPNGTSMNLKPGQRVWIMVPKGELHEMFIMSLNNK